MVDGELGPSNSMHDDLEIFFGRMTTLTTSYSSSHASVTIFRSRFHQFHQGSPSHPLDPWDLDSVSSLGQVCLQLIPLLILGEPTNISLIAVKLVQSSGWDACPMFGLRVGRMIYMIRW